MDDKVLNHTMFINSKIYITFTLLIIFNVACDNRRDALGAENEIRVICSEIDRESVKEYLSLIFIDTLFTPEPEPYFHLKFSNPETYPDLKSQSQVIVAAISRNIGNTGYQLVKKILPEEQFSDMEKTNPVILAKDVNANKQLFMVINAHSKNQLMSTLEKNRNNFRKYFNEHFIERQSRYTLESHRNNKLEDSLKLEYGWNFKIPWGWERIKNKPDSNFVWIGKEMPFQWIGIGWEEGNMLIDELYVGDYMWNWPRENYQSIQLHNYKFKLDKTNYRKSYAWRAQGVWETIDLKESKGGPFKSYMFYDELNNRTFHINYLIHHPGKDKSIFMRQMDMIIKTFKIY